MDKLPIEVIRQIYEYDSTFKIKFDKVLKQLMAHCFIYNCRICCKPYNNCCCYCSVCKKPILNSASKSITTKGQLMKMNLK